MQDIQKTYTASRKKMDIVTVGWACSDRVDSLSSSSHHSLCNSITYWRRCSYRTAGSSLVIHGRVTDFQMWDRVLPDFQLEEVETIFNLIFNRSPDAASSRRATWSTGLRRRGTWIPHLALWVISVPSFHIKSIQFALALLQAKREELDLEGSVCAKSSTSLQILPHKTNVMEPCSLFFSIIIFPSDEACSITSLLQIFRKGKSHFKL